MRSDLPLCFASTWSVPLVPLLWSSGNERILLVKSPEHRAKGWGYCVLNCSALVDARARMPEYCKQSCGVSQRGSAVNGNQ